MNFSAKSFGSTNCDYKKPTEPLCVEKSGQSLYVLMMSLNLKNPKILCKFYTQEKYTDQTEKAV